VDSEFLDKKGRQKVQFKGEMEGATVLEWKPNAEPFDLKEGKFTFFMPYSYKEGNVSAKPSIDSPYMKTWVASCEVAGKKGSEYKGEFITIEQVDYPWFKVKTKQADGTVTEETITVQMWKLANDEKFDSPAVQEYVASILTGKNDSSALRELTLNQRASQYPQYKDALKSGAIGTLLPIKMGETGVYEKV
jgi:hypothetical protein